MVPEEGENGEKFEQVDAVYVEQLEGVYFKCHAQMISVPRGRIKVKEGGKSAKILVAIYDFVGKIETQTAYEQ